MIEFYRHLSSPQVLHQALGYKHEEGRVATLSVWVGHVLNIIMRVSSEALRTWGGSLQCWEGGHGLSLSRKLTSLPDLNRRMESYKVDRWQGMAFLTERSTVGRCRGRNKACSETCLALCTSVMSLVD